MYNIYFKNAHRYISNTTIENPTNNIHEREPSLTRAQSWSLMRHTAREVHHTAEMASGNNSHLLKVQRPMYDCKPTSAIAPYERPCVWWCNIREITAHWGDMKKGNCKQPESKILYMRYERNEYLIAELTVANASSSQ